jgi:60 kDa SS-A/Ro ribonucleoprotein
MFGALFTAVLVKANNADLITFDAEARYVNVNPLDSTITVTNSLTFPGTDTRFNTIFPVANKKYDRVIILSDMQGWGSDHAPTREFEEWKKRTGSDPYLYSFDLKNYGSLQFPESKLLCLAGFSDKIFGIMALLEKDRNALVNEVKKIKL